MAPNQPEGVCLKQVRGSLVAITASGWILFGSVNIYWSLGMTVTNKLLSQDSRRMYSFMGGGLFCASLGNILLVVSTATDYWMQYRLAGVFAHQGLWKYCFAGRCYKQLESVAYWNASRAFMILATLSCFAGIITGILSFAQFSSFQRFNRSFAAAILFFASTLFILFALAIYTGVTVKFLGKRFGEWCFSWSYILGWVALLMTFFAGIFYMCAYRMHECQRLAEAC